MTANGVVYVGTHYDGNLYAFNEVTGSMAWNFPTKGPLDSPAVASGIVYVGSQDGHVYAVNASTGKQVWSRSTGKIVESSPALASGQVYIGNDSGTLFSLNASTGTVSWSLTPDSLPIEDSPAIYGGDVFIATDYGRVYSIDAATHTIAWSRANGFIGGELSSPAIANGVLFIGDANGSGGYPYIDALDAASGKPLWAMGTGRATTRARRSQTGWCTSAPKAGSSTPSDSETPA